MGMAERRLNSNITIGATATLLIVLHITDGLNIAYAQTDIIQVSDKTPKDNPCPKNIVPDDIYTDFKDILKNVLAKGGVINDINSQVKNKVPDNKEKPVDIEITVATLDTFKNMYANDVDSLYHDKTVEQLKQDAEGFFNNHAAFTYITDTLTNNDVQKINMVIFCKESFRISTIDKNIYKLLSHEFVHVKRYTMLVLGTEPSFEDHDATFNNEVDKLLKTLSTNLRLSFSSFINVEPTLARIGQAVYITLCATNHPIKVLSAIIQTPTGSSFVDQSKTEISLAECNTWNTSIDFDLPMNEIGSYYVKIVTEDSNTLSSELSVLFSVLPESMIGAIVIIGLSIIILYMYSKMNQPHRK